MKFIARVLIVLSGVLLVVVGYRIWLDRKKAVESRTWPTAAGSITNVDIGSYTSGSVKSRNRKTRYYPRAEYTYQVARRGYRSTRYSWEVIDDVWGRKFYPDRQAALDAAGNWHAGDSVRVYYSPLEPDMAVVSTAPPKDAGGRALAATLFGLGLVVGGFKKKM